MEKVLNQILNKLDSIETEMKVIKVGLEKLEARQEKLEAGQEKLKVGQEKLEAGQEKLKVGQEKLKVGQERIERKISGIPEQYQKLEDYLGKQHLTVVTLSARSIEHEAEINDLKRLVKNQ
jgi:uncharacterized phage infection (PIP) family protein YhgE